MDMVTVLNKTNKSKCNDCGMFYGDGDWIDTILTHDQWLLIAKREEILCANCIVKRASKIGVISIKAKLMFAEDY
ncbi:MAG: hypothetical protein WCS56_02030 [Bacilli bacterium]